MTDYVPTVETIGDGIVLRKMSAIGDSLARDPDDKDENEDEGHPEARIDRAATEIRRVQSKASEQIEQLQLGLKHRDSYMQT